MIDRNGYGESSDSESSGENSNENTSTVNNQPVSKLKKLAYTWGRNYFFFFSDRVTYEY